jgi:hypothetical protein
MWVVYRFVDGELYILFSCTTEKMAETLARQYSGYYYAAPRDGYFA